MLETLKIPKEEFYKKIGITSANFRGNAKYSPLNSNTIENILTEIPSANPEWLLTGKGPMLRSEPPAPMAAIAVSERDFYETHIEKKDKKIEELSKEVGRLQERLIQFRGDETFTEEGERFSATSTMQEVHTSSVLAEKLKESQTLKLPKHK